MTPNPYAGLRPLNSDETLHGRDRDLRMLADLLIAERILLLYSPSAAGKTSLIEAGLIPLLKGKGFDVLPRMRVGLAPVGEPSSPESADNPYVVSALLSIEEQLPPERRISPGDLAKLTFPGYLERSRIGIADPPPQVLVFDQFEEIFMAPLTDPAARSAFFDQIGAALRDGSRWALFSMREEFVPALHPHRSQVPTRFDTSFRLNLLSGEAALQAVVEPAGREDVQFTEDAAKRLVADLQRATVQTAECAPEPDSCVEPIQLQVVCRQLWDKLPAGTRVIEPQHLHAMGSADETLRGYYAERVETIAKAARVEETTIRSWFDERLITDGDSRAQVSVERGDTGGLPNEVVLRLVDAQLLRSEPARAGVRLELAHERLIKPIRHDNAAWRLDQERMAKSPWVSCSPTAVAEGSWVDYALSPSRRKGTALCLSGNGFRAVLFQLGALRRLNELGMLSAVDTVCGVSGGSILAAQLAVALASGSWPETTKAWDSTIAEPIRALAHGGIYRTVDAISAFFDLFSHLRTPLRRPFVEALGNRYERRLTRMKLCDLPETPRFVFCATELLCGLNWTFERQRMGNYRAGFVTPPAEWSVARAVAVSSCPVYLAPLALKWPDTVQYEPGTAQHPRRIGGELFLGNGQLYDKMALQPASRHKTLLVIDGTASGESGPVRGFLPRMLRAISVLDNQARATQRRWLMQNFTAQVVDGVYVPLGTVVGRRGDEAAGYSKEFLNDCVVQMRDHIDRHSAAEIAVVENHGYILANDVVNRRGPMLVRREGMPMAVPHPAWLDEGLARKHMARSHRYRLFA